MRLENINLMFELVSVNHVKRLSYERFVTVRKKSNTCTMLLRGSCPSANFNFNDYK